MPLDDVPDNPAATVRFYNNLFRTVKHNTSHLSTTSKPTFSSWTTGALYGSSKNLYITVRKKLIRPKPVWTPFDIWHHENASGKTPCLALKPVLSVLFRVESRN